MTKTFLMFAARPWPGGRVFDKPACRGGPGSLKPGRCNQEPPMSGIATILVFLVVIAALNVFEFGRLD